MGEIIFVGLGLYNERDMSIRAMETIESADFVFLEHYTSLMSGLSIENLKNMTGKDIIFVDRKILEEEDGLPVLVKAENARVALLVAGDPLIATTHIDLRIRAEKRGIKTKIIHGSSIITAAMGLAGLQNYRFGKSVTIPFKVSTIVSETPYTVIAENKNRDLHTFLFLDIDTEKNKYMKIVEALDILLNLAEKKGSCFITSNSLAIGVARAGAEDVFVKAESINNLSNIDFGGPPHMLIMPAKHLHFMEAEALIVLAGAPDWIRKNII